MTQSAIDLIRLDGCHVRILELPPFNRASRLDDMATYLHQQMNQDFHVILGFCFGGILAQEVGNRFPGKKIIIVSAIKSHTELTCLSKILLRVFIHTPVQPLSVIGQSVNYILLNLLKTRIRLPRIWLKHESNRFIAKTFSCYKGAGSNANIIHIHGEKDRLFNPKKMQKVRLVEKAGHFVLTQRHNSFMAVLSDAISPE